MSTVTSLLESTAKKWPEKDFLRMQEGSITYQQMLDRSARLAQSFLDLGIRQGSPVVLMMSNSIDQVVCWYALNRIGAIHAPLNTSWVGAPIQNALSIAQPMLIVADDELFAAIEPALHQVGLNPTIVIRSESGEHSSHISLSSLMENPKQSAVVNVDPLTTATLLFTSGTSGRSKACELSNTYLIRAGQLHAKYVGITEDDVLYCPFPLFHIDAATLTVMAALATGATAALSKRFSVSRYWDDVRHYDATIFNFMGATLSMLWKQPPSDNDLNHRVRLAWGVPIPDWQPEFEKRFGFPIFQVYGLTDAGVPVYDPQDGTQRYGYAGVINDEYDIRIVDSNLQDVPDLTPGEIIIRGKEAGLMMNGYYGMPKETHDSFIDGWYRSGDLGQLDGKYLAFLGRLSDSIRRRGENISAFEVEEMVSAHPAVLEACAIGVPSELTEEDVKVVVVLKHGHTDSHEDIYEFCVQTGVRYMLPKYIEFASELPKTPTEKVEKYKLKENWKNVNTWDSDLRTFLSV